jgi:hypothetical protein
MDGETVAFEQPFSNGLMYPGDEGADADETAGCTCVMTISGQPRQIPDWMHRAVDKVLQTGDITEGDVIGRGINGARWGRIDGMDVVLKNVYEDEAQFELLAQTLNDKYGFGLNMPRVVVREEEGGLRLVSMAVPDAEVGALAEIDGIPYAQRRAQSFFDVVVNNVDRNSGNFLVDAEDNLISIDHSLAFSFEMDESAVYSEMLDTMSDADFVLDDAQRGILYRMDADIQAKPELDDVDEMLLSRITQILNNDSFNPEEIGSFL